MPERPRPGGSESGEDFTWLYGGRSSGQSGQPDGRDEQDDMATRAIPTQPRMDRPRADPDDRTEVMRTQPRDQPPARPMPPQPLPTPGQLAPTPGAGDGSGGGRGGGIRGWFARRARRPRFWIRLVLSLLVLWLVFLVAVPFFAWQKVDQVSFEPSGDRPAEQPGTTYLMVGSDSRGDLTKAERKELGTGNAAGQRTDTIMLLHTGSGPNLLMSIPRDSIVDVPGHGTTKINAAFAFGGPELLTETIEDNTGIRVDNYVEIGFGGFVDLVDAVNGVEICPKQRMKDKLAKLDIKKGCQEADGPTALAYARSRHTSGLGDIERAKHQREVVSAIGSKLVSPWTVLNPFRYYDINMAGTKAVAFGDGMSPIRAALWARAMTKVNGDDGLTCGVPIADLAVNWDSERAPQLFKAIIDDDTDSVGKSLCSPTGIAR